MSPILEFNKVCAQNSEIEALHEFSLQVDAGQCIALLGTQETGSALPLYLSNKMTLADSGEIKLFDKNINEYAIHEIFQLRAQMPLIQGEPVFLNNIPMRNNLLLPLLYHTNLEMNEIEERLTQANQLFDIGEITNQLPALFDRTKQKKLAIARAIAMQPKILLLEQPTWNLRTADRPLLAKALKHLRHEHQTTLFLTTNDFGLASEVADVICLFDNGQIVEQGAPEEVKKAQTKHPKIWGTLEIQAL